ncbi:MAG: CRISPR-associated endonuclease Cas2 [Myxococcota bacterium]
MRLLVAYDIETRDDAGERRLREVARLMEGFGIRVQRSVFECELNSAQQAKLEMSIAAVIDPRCDSVLVYRLAPQKTLRLGKSGPDPFTPIAFVR